MISLRVAYAAAASLAVLFAAPTLRAADDPRAEEASRADFQEGVRAVDRGDYEGARISFSRSYAIWPTGRALLNLASMEARTGHCVEALPHLRKYGGLPDADPEVKSSLIPQLTDSCDKLVGHLRIAAPAGAVLSVDDHRIADPSEIVVVEPGSHRIQAKAPEGTTSRSLTVAAGSTADVELGPAAARVPAADVPPESSREAFWNTQRTIGASVAVAGAVSVAFGVLFNQLSTSAQGDADGIARQVGPSGCFGPAMPSSCLRLADERSTQKTEAQVSEALLIAGGIALAGGAVAFFWPSGQGSAHATVSPLLTPMGYGLTVHGGF